MKVYGKEVPQVAYNAVWRVFNSKPRVRYKELVAAVYEVVSMHDLCAERFVDRWLQKQKRKGNIEYRNKRWYLTNQTLAKSLDPEKA